MNLRITFDLGVVEAVAGTSPIFRIVLNVVLIKYNRAYGKGTGTQDKVPSRCRRVDQVEAVLISRLC